MSTRSLDYPLSKRALHDAFDGIEPESIRVRRGKGWTEACVDGAWSFARLTRHMRSLGLERVGGRDSRCFVDESGKVGVVLHGVDTHPTKNAFKSWTIEVFARKDANIVRMAL